MTLETEREFLERARSGLVIAREKMSALIGTGNLTRGGPPRSGIGQAIQHHQNGRFQVNGDFDDRPAKSSQQIDREVTGSGHLKLGPRPRKQSSGGATRHSVRKVEALKLGTMLTVPLSRNNRPVNADGSSSFHFSHEAIAKTRGEKTTSNGTKTRKGAAKSHAKYLEREAAVARLADGIHRSHGLSDGQQLQAAIGQAASAGRYIEREEAVAYAENGVPVLYSNISQDDAAVRAEFWGLVEQFEVEPNPDYVVVTTSQDIDFWQAIKADPRCPAVLASAIEKADPLKPCRVVTENNEIVREIMADYGWAPSSAVATHETTQEKLERQKRDFQNAKGAECVDGRGGHIQNRIVGELPHDVRPEARVRILRRFAQYFEDKKLPYVAVMHAPDHANNKKNWHFHLAYYERPCRRFSGEADDHLPKNPPANNWRAQAIYDLKAKALASGDLEQFIDQWDFTVPVKHKTKCGHTRLTYPFFQDKIRECNHKNLPWELRKKLAEFTNDELMAAGLGRCVDPRRYDEMGISKEPAEHLGSRSAQLETLGVPTPRGVANEAKQWQWELTQIAQKLEAEKKVVANQARRWRQDMDIAISTSEDKAKLRRFIDIWSQKQTGANECRAIADELKQQYARLKSRAQAVSKTCQQHLDAIDQSRATRRQRENRQLYSERLAEAVDHLAGLKVLMAPEIDAAQACEINLLELKYKASVFVQKIEARLKEGFRLLKCGKAIEVKAESKDTFRHLTPSPASSMNNSTAEVLLPEPTDSQVGTLSPNQLEQFIKRLVEEKRRLTEVDGAVAPLNPTGADLLIMTAANFADVQPEMMKLKQTQDQQIAELKYYLMRHPDAVALTGQSSSNGHPLYELVVKDARLKEAFAHYRDDPLIKGASEIALKAQRASRAQLETKLAVTVNSWQKNDNIKSERHGVAAEKAPADAPSTLELGTTQPLPMRQLTEVERTGTMVSRLETTEGSLHQLDRAAMDRHGLTETSVALLGVQLRLAAIDDDQQQREIARLVGFAKAYPKRITVIAQPRSGESMPSVVLAGNAPPELRILATKLAKHPGAQEQLSEAVTQASRTAGAETSTIGAAAPQAPHLQAAPKALQDVGKSDVTSILAGQAGDAVHAARGAVEQKAESAPLGARSEPPQSPPVIETPVPGPAVGQWVGASAWPSGEDHRPTGGENVSKAIPALVTANPAEGAAIAPPPAERSIETGKMAETTLAEPIVQPASAGRSPTSRPDEPVQTNSSSADPSPPGSPRDGNGVKVDKTDISLEHSALQQRHDLLTPPVLGNSKAEKVDGNGSAAETAAMPSLPAGGPATAERDRALRDLAKRTALKLGDAYLQLRTDIQKFSKLPDGPDKDRLAYTINYRFGVPLSERNKYPALSKVFAASDRNLAALKLADRNRDLKNQKSFRSPT